MAISSDFRSRIAESAVAAFLIVKPGVGAMSCVPATAATDKLLGAADELAHPVGGWVDVSLGPVGKVVLGATVAAGDALTANASGQAIATTTTGNRIIGFAEIAGVSGDVITYLHAPGVL